LIEFTWPMRFDPEKNAQPSIAFPIREHLRHICGDHCEAQSIGKPSRRASFDRESREVELTILT